MDNEGLERDVAERTSDQSRVPYGGKKNLVAIFEGSARDLLLAVRSLARHRSFALPVILTLALGIGVTTAIFSVVYAVLLRPLPYTDASRLALIWGDMRARDVADFPFSPANYQDLKSGTKSFEDIAALAPGNWTLIARGDRPERVTALGVTPNLLTVLGVRVLRGRGFTAADAVAPSPQGVAGREGVAADATLRAPPPPHMIILNYDFWQRRFGGDERIVGTSVELDGNSAIIVGVMDDGFELLFPPNTNIGPNPDILLAMRIDYERASPTNMFLRLIGRLRPEATGSSAQADVERTAAVVREKLPILKAAELHYRVETMQEDLVKDVRPTLLAIMGAVTFVLLIACANVANLILVRAVARERELALRAILGSSKWRIARQLLIESVLLAGAGAIVGLALTWVGLQGLVALAPANLPRLESVRVDPVVLGFALMVGLIAATISGLAPALRVSNPNVIGVLRATGRTPALSRATWLRNAIVVIQVALSFVLLIGAGLMVRSSIALASINPGYDPKGLLTFTIGTQGGRSADERATLVRQLRDAFAAIPGVQGVAASSPLPLDGALLNARWGKEEAATDPTKFQQANLHRVLPGYFEVMGTRLLAGRAYTDADNTQSVRDVVIDDILARKAFPAESAIGKRLYVRSRGQEAEWHTIIGVVEHQRHESLSSEGREGVFLTDGFFGHGTVGTWQVRVRCTEGRRCDPTRVVTDIQKAVAQVDPKLAVARIEPYQALIDRAMTPTRFALVLIAAFGGVAVVLTLVGVYGVLSTAVRQRTSELGVRMALGATKSRILTLVIRDGIKLVAVGLVIGSIAAYWLTGAMGTMLVNTKANDGPTYAGALAIFFAISLAACWLPARRAASLDPSDALRAD